MQFSVPAAESYSDGFPAACGCTGVLGGGNLCSVKYCFISRAVGSSRHEIRAIKRKGKEKKRNMGMKLVFYLTYYHPGNKHSFLLLPILTSCRGQLWVMDLTAIDKKVKEQNLVGHVSHNLYLWKSFRFSVPRLPHLLCVNDFRLWLPKFVYSLMRIPSTSLSETATWLEYKTQ